MAAPNQQQNHISASLYAGDLHPDVDEATLYEVFNSVGPVASIRVCRDSVTRRSLGYSYVNYHSIADAERALDTLNYSPIKSVPVRLMWAHRDPSLRKTGAGNIFVKNLDKNIDNKALYDTFSLFGNILSCKVSVDDQGRSRGFGFVHYENDDSAKTAIQRVNGMKIGEKTVFVGGFQRKVERTSLGDMFFTNLYVKDIPEGWTEETLKKVFDTHGEVTSLAIKQDAQNRRFCFVNYKLPECARAAIDSLNGGHFDDDGNRLPDVTEDSENVSEEAAKAEEKAGEGEDKKVDEGEEGSTPEKKEKPKCLYVGRFQPKHERTQLLKGMFEGNVTPTIPDRKYGVNLYIKNLDDTVDDEKLRSAFEHFGTITSAKVMIDEKGVSKGFGFVCFLNPEEATKAVTDMHLKLMNGKPLYVGLHERREQRISRLQQRYRMPMRPGVQGIPPQIQFGAPPQMFFGPSGMQGGRPVMPFQQGGGVMPWRPHSTRPFQGNQPVPRMNQGPNKQPLGFKFTPQARNRDFPGPGGPNGPMQGGPHMVAGAESHGWPMRPQPQQQPHHQFSADPPSEQLTPQALAAATPNIQKQMLGERLFPLIAKHQPELAGKITGMMLEMDNAELLMLLDSDAQLKAKLDEAMRVLQHASD